VSALYGAEWPREQRVEYAGAVYHEKEASMGGSGARARTTGVCRHSLRTWQTFGMVGGVCRLDRDEKGWLE